MLTGDTVDSTEAVMQLAASENDLGTVTHPKMKPGTDAFPNRSGHI